MIREFLNYFFSMIEAAVLLGIVGSLFPGRYRKRIMNIVAFVIAVLCGTFAINGIGFNLFVQTILLMAFFTLLCQILYEGFLYIKIFYLLFAYYICIVSEIALSDFILLLPDEQVVAILHDIRIETAVTIGIKAVIIVLGILFARYFMKLRPKLSMKYWFVLNIIILFFIEILQLSTYMELKMKDSMQTDQTYFVFMTIGIGMLSVFVLYFLGKISWVYERQTEFELYKLRSIELEKLLSYKEQSELEMKKIKHDMNKNLTNISYLLKEEKRTEAESYLNSISNVLNESKEIIHSGNYVVDAILNYRISLCKNKKIDLRLSVDEIYDFWISPVDISAILDNLLDNAIEAVEKYEENLKWIEVKIFSYKRNMTILVKNPFDGLLRKSKHEIMTTKKEREKHGYGLKSIKTSVEKNRGTYQYFVEKKSIHIHYNVTISRQ